jgi:hypothetical protein
MRSLSKPERYEAFSKIGMLCVLRRDSDSSEETIAEKLNFGSAESMYTQLKNWGLPGWLVYGEAQQSMSDEAPVQERKRKPRAKRVGGAVPLPPAEEASALFKYDVELLRKEIEKLTGREEFLQNGRFTGTRPETFPKYIWRREDFITGEGEEKGKEMWEKLCKEYGKDPADEQIEGDPTFHLALGALQAPAEPPAEPRSGLRPLP